MKRSANVNATTVEQARARLHRWLVTIINSCETEDAPSVILSTTADSFSGSIEDANRHQMIFQCLCELDEPVARHVDAILEAAMNDLDAIYPPPKVSVMYTAQIEGRAERLTFTLWRDAGASESESEEPMEHRDLDVSDLDTDKDDVLQFLLARLREEQRFARERWREKTRARRARDERIRAFAETAHTLLPQIVTVLAARSSIASPDALLDPLAPLTEAQDASLFMANARRLLETFMTGDPHASSRIHEHLTDEQRAILADMLIVLTREERVRKEPIVTPPPEPRARGEA